VYNIKFTNTATKNLKKIDKRFHKHLKKKLETIVKDPFKTTTKIQDKSLDGTRKCRQGDFRIFVNIDKINKIVYVTSINNRNSAYNPR